MPGSRSLPFAQARVPWTAAEDRKLTRLYPRMSAAECATELGRGLSSVTQRVSALGLHKSPEWVAERTRQRWAEGRNEGCRGSHFKAGQSSWNKGRKGWRAGGRSAETRFQKGSMSGAAQHNYVPVGSLRISKDGYLERKVTDDPNLYPARRWSGVHRLVWEAANGPVPPGHAVVFLPGRRTANESAITLDAVELVTRAELMRRNTRHRFPKELNDLIALKAALTRKINNKERKA